MRIKFLNNTLKNRQYDYTPRYYDERKEQLDGKKKLYDRLHNNELTSEDRRQMLRESMSRSWSNSDYKRRETQKYNIRILILVLVLCALMYFILYGVDEVDNIVKKLW